MIGPVVAKMAVEQATKAGSAIGDIYFFGAVGSIVGTFLAGFVLMYLAPVSAIVTLVAAALAVLAAVMLGGRIGSGPRPPRGGVPGTRLGAGRGRGRSPFPGDHARVDHGQPHGPGRARADGPAGGRRPGELNAARAASAAIETDVAGARELARRGESADAAKPSLGDLAVLSFIASLAFMALEMVAGPAGHPPPRVEHLRLDERHRRPARRPEPRATSSAARSPTTSSSEKQASWLFLVASVLTLSASCSWRAPPSRSAKPLAGQRASRC